jgi:hypothetical protein
MDRTAGLDVIGVGSSVGNRGGAELILKLRLTGGGARGFVSVCNVDTEAGNDGGSADFATIGRATLAAGTKI